MLSMAMFMIETAITDAIQSNDNPQIMNKLVY